MKNKIQAKVAQAFSTKLADAVDTFTCEKPIYSGEFDFETQTYPIIGSESYSGRGVLFGSYLKDLVKPADYQVEDAKAIVLQNEVTAAPQIDDVWNTVKGDFEVKNIGSDPVSATYIIQLRKVGV
ncbi:glutamate 5-kinase [Acinetobacter haemolyticus]|uniref:glutamate 5-kinase n=1 Tax=Acinetobacter haemolyticus TaxID=29430 RepID=UPI001331F62C|nr:glutamate 5-kinase [Acinetobacter haemolyticus]QHI18260.1 glutamate 5-kinase [Acinetobacter haemolyticus]QHI18307.1 glutamate 5-kinase [Acinetobacter haemolyticus]